MNPLNSFEHQAPQGPQSIHEHDVAHERDDSERDKPPIAARRARLTLDTVLTEPRWTLDGKPAASGPRLRLVEPYWLLSATTCGHLPVCWGCGAVVQRSDVYYSFSTRYLDFEPTGDVVVDYVHGGTLSGPYAPICCRCCPALDISRDQERNELARQVDRCDAEIAEMEDCAQRVVTPAWLVVLGVEDWREEKELLLKRGPVAPVKL